MERSESTTSASSSSSLSRSGSSSGPFAYQTRLLERHNARAGSISRSGSLSGTSLLNSGPNGSTVPASPSPTRRWTPGHRVGASLEAVRGKWEERAKAEAEVAPENSTGSGFPALSTPTRGSTHAGTLGRSDSLAASGTYGRAAFRRSTDNLTQSPPQTAAEVLGQRTPTYLKRRTLPTPIIASPLSPDSTGVSVEDPGPSIGSTSDAHLPSTLTPKVNRINLPSIAHFPSPASTTPSRDPRSNILPSSISGSSSMSARSNVLPSSIAGSSATVGYSTRLRRANTIETIAANFTGSSTHSTASDVSVASTASTATLLSQFPATPGSSSVPAPERATLGRRSTFEHISNSQSRAESPEKLDSLSSIRTPSLSPDKTLYSRSILSPSPTPLSTSPVMSPSPYRSSYMSAKKASTYGDNLVVGRKLGRHLPRIASGDADDDWEAEDQPPPPPPMPLKTEPRHEAPPSEPPESPRLERRNARVVRDLAPLTANPTPRTPERRSVDFGTMPRTPMTPITPNSRTPAALPLTPTTPTGPATGDDVAGIPGRLRLSRSNAASISKATAPLPSSKLTNRAGMGRWGLWADTQRHLLQAYEYLCHVGEAQQWIEGCLGEELGFGVVEMDEKLRNGVVLAKLCRVFQGEGIVRRIWDAPRLDFRHSDNINIFFNFVREVGLPESFIFELTDLYDKKNIPKVIYCIHALSHLLARRGMAERIGNLVGHLKFSDDQLELTQKGLNAAGVAMPNFGNVGRELAKDLNEEPEPEPEPEETDEERRDRELMECEDSIVGLQSRARAFLVRKNVATQRGRLRIAERYVPKLQARCRAVLVRRSLNQQRKERMDLTPWARGIQTAARGLLARRDWKLRLSRIKAIKGMIIKVQAQSRGVLQRRRFALLKSAIRKSIPAVIKLQTIARARVTRKSHTEVAKSFAQPQIMHSVVALQAQCHGVLARWKDARLLGRLHSAEPYVVQLQAHTRGVLMRRRVRNQLAKLDDVSGVVVRIQAAVRTFLARRRLLALIRGLRRATPTVVGLQSFARAKLAQRQHKALSKALGEVKVVKSVGGFQALARAALARNRHKEQTKQLEFCAPDVTGFQASARGALVRRDWHAWRNHLWNSQAEASMLQALIRGVLQRRKFRAKMQHYRANMDKVVKIQSLFRAKETREQYRQLTLGKNVNVGTIKNFVHLLDDSEADFQEELQVERLRKKVVEGIRENQTLESEVNDLDVKIALVVQNVKNFEDVIKARRRHDNAGAHAARASLLAAHGDPFAGPSTLDHEARRKLELYQQLFYLLQTRGEYLSKLFMQMSMGEVPERNRRLTERVVLTLFGYAQNRREDYLLLKLFQTAIQDEVASARTIDDIIHGHPMYMNIAVQYVRPKQVPFVRETLQSDVRYVLDADDLDLDVDPCAIYRARIELEEMRSGVTSSKPKDLPFYQALEDPPTRVKYIHHLQNLQWRSESFLNALLRSTKRMPYGMRYLARETLRTLQERFPDAPTAAYASCMGRLIFYRYINPAILTPETFDIVSSTIDITSRKNLAHVSKVLAQVTSGTEFGDDTPGYVPINDFVRVAIHQMSAWFMEIANVPDAETEFHAHEFLDATVQPRPIYISPNEVYAMHSLLSQHLDGLVNGRDDPLAVILHELGGVPNLGSDELKDARDTAITLELTNRFAHVRDPKADEKTYWVQAKRGVLAILRVQPAKDLVESLMQPVTDAHEITWEEIVENEMIMDHKQHRNNRQPSATGYESAYRLEDIRQMTFREVKAHAIFYLIELEKMGKITRTDGYQGILNAIAGDVRSKHRKRLQRQQEMESMHQALKHLADRKKYFQEQINSYHDYVEESMRTMQRGKGKKRFVMPFTKQYFHLRDLQKSGKSPQFGSFKYSAQSFYDKGILLSIDQFSPKQFDKIDIVISSNQVGVFTMEIFNNALGITNRVAAADVKMEDLLQAQFENKSAISLFKGIAKFNLNLLLYQINKKFYV